MFVCCLLKKIFFLERAPLVLPPPARGGGRQGGALFCPGGKALRRDRKGGNGDHRGKSPAKTARVAGIAEMNGNDSHALSKREPFRSQASLVQREVANPQGLTEGLSFPKVYNPSVSLSADSPLYTRGPLPRFSDTRSLSLIKIGDLGIRERRRRRRLFPRGAAPAALR